MRADRVRQGAVVLALFVTVTLNALANILPLNNQTTGDIANRYPVRFIPANYVFSIWSLIYAGLIGYAVYQALPTQRTNERLRRTGWRFVLTCVLNCAWLVLWHYEFFILTIPVMIALVWTVVLLAVGVGIAAMFLRNKPDVAYVAVLIWAFAGIAVKQSDTPLVVIAAVGATLVIAALLVITLLHGGPRGRVLQRAA